MVRFESVTKVFPNGFIGLEDISFEIDPGSLLYVTGESGAGKTTLMRLLIREILPTQGRIYFKDLSVADLPAHRLPQLRRQIGVVFQDYQLIPDRTIRENTSIILEIMGVKSDQIKKRVSDVLEIVGLPDKVDLFPVQLSGGELQRAAIARAMVTAPDLLFADEPTGNLDEETAEGIIALLRRIRDLGTTVIVSTHDKALRDKNPGDHLELRQGKIVNLDKITTNQPGRSDGQKSKATEKENKDDKKSPSKTKAPIESSTKAK